jgi:diaminohydroxyphosphoribosylaminopyrimidine deaminase/5-amino-6-(5-phosphoribosylamino)uracil reductase
VPTAHQPLRVVIDSRLDMPLEARILQAPGRVLVYAAEPTDARRRAFETARIEVVRRPASTGKVDLAAVLADLAAQHGVNELHVEAGHKLNGSFVREGLVDELLIYVAPRLIGAGRELAAFGPLASLDDAVGLRYTAADRIGDDLRIVARRTDPASF